MLENCRQIAKNLHDSIEMLEKRYVSGTLYYRNEGGTEDWRVCGMGALSMTKFRRPAYTVGTQGEYNTVDLKDELEFVAQAIEGAPEDGGFWSMVKRTFQHTLQGEGERRHLAAQRVIVALNDGPAGKANVLRLLQSAACLADAESSPGPSPQSEGGTAPSTGE